MLHEVIVFRVTVRADSAVLELVFPLEKNTETERERQQIIQQERPHVIYCIQKPYIVIIVYNRTI